MPCRSTYPAGHKLLSASMHPKYKKIYCCTPVAFHANDGFWIRDTGLISNTLRNMGVESKCIMPLPHYEDDQAEHLIRTEYKNLKSAAWWKSLGIDALILYSWGAPRYLPIARAIHKAGIRLHIHLDTSGNFEGSNYNEMPFVRKIIHKLRILSHDFFRAWHLRYADTISAGEPVLQYIATRLFYGKWIVTRGFPLASPISSKFLYFGNHKQPIVLFVGRWNDTHQKRPEFMMKSIEHLIYLGIQAEIKIIGTITDEIRQWHSKLPTTTAIKLIGYIPNNKLISEYNNAQIIACCSKYEGSHVVSSEALCCGVSVVATNRPKSLRTVHWYTSKNSGRISNMDSPNSFAEAIHDELLAWKKNERNPHTIAESWHPFLHADKMLNRIFEH